MIQECFKQLLKCVNMTLLLGMVLVLLLLHALASGGDDDENEFKSDETENGNVNDNNSNASQLINFELSEARLKEKHLIGHRTIEYVPILLLELSGE